MANETDDSFASRWLKAHGHVDSNGYRQTSDYAKEDNALQTHWRGVLEQKRQQLNATHLSILQNQKAGATDVVARLQTLWDQLDAEYTDIQRQRDAARRELALKYKS